MPQPHWGDNVVSADFSRGRGGTGQSTTVPSRPAVRSAEVPHASDLSKESWAATIVMRTATSHADSGRLSRGRTYFNKGSVLQFDHELGSVTGLVTGTQLEPFEVQIRWRPLSTRQLDFIIGECGDHQENLRLLLAGSRPLPEVSAVLFGVDQYMDSWCTCPDHGSFCKHRVCLCYALAAEFSRDPVAFLAWRGIDADALLRKARASEEEGAAQQAQAPESVEFTEPETAGDAGPEFAGQDSPADPGDGTRYMPAEFWGSVGDVPQWEPFDVDFGLEMGDHTKRDAAIRKFSWNNVDQLRVLHTLTQCYEVLTDTDGIVSDSEQVFDREPWLSDPADRSGNHD
ncbi:MAG: SWIM zinc finger family protein [Mycobacteriaceae bacterium]|uniref:SWIM zinc finger family protein n=1 Tax=Corynebacterium sp. TaxID=1720 RepID=UPI003F984CEA